MYREYYEQIGKVASKDIKENEIQDYRLPDELVSKAPFRNRRFKSGKASLRTNFRIHLRLSNASLPSHLLATSLSFPLLSELHFRNKVKV